MSVVKNKTVTSSPISWAHTQNDPYRLCYYRTISRHTHIRQTQQLHWWSGDHSHLNHRLTHWDQVTHICVSKLTIIGSDNGLSPGRRQAIIWNNAEKLLIGPLRTNFNEMLIEILSFSFMKMRLKVSSAKWRPFYLGFNVLRKLQVSIWIDFVQKSSTWLHRSAFECTAAALTDIFETVSTW